MVTILKIICKRCKKDLMKNVSSGCDEGYASRLIDIHDNVVHGHNYQISVRGKCLE